MNYKDLYSNFKAMFPECNGSFQSLEQEANADETDGMHIMFSFVVIPFILDLLKNDEKDKLKKAFDYFEKMALSDSADITEVLEFTVLENLMSNGQDIYGKAKSYMGNNTMDCSKKAEQYLQIVE